MIYAYVNGKTVPAHRASVSVFDRGLVLGDGLFESLRAVDYIPEFLKEHFSRFRVSAHKLRIKIPVDQKELGRITHMLCKKSRLKDAAVRITLTRGEYMGGLSQSRSVPPTLIVTVRSVSGMSPKVYSEGVNITVSTISQEAAGGVDPTMKTLNYLGNVMAKAEADRKGCYEALLLGKNGKIAELSTSSFFGVIRGKVVTPSMEIGILPGITRRKILTISNKLGLEPMEKIIRVKDISRFEEAFLTSSIRGVVPVVGVDGEKIRDGKVGPVSEKIIEHYLIECKANRTRLSRLLEK